MQRIKIFKNEKVLRRNCYGSKGWLDSVFVLDTVCGIAVNP